MSSFRNDPRQALNGRSRTQSPTTPPTSQSQAAQEAEDAPIPIHGHRQIVEMLRVADPSFRESLLRRIAARDRELALSLKRALLSLEK